jgi:surface carbohydrate biosynthesis protein
VKLANLARLTIQKPNRGEVVIFDSFSERHFRPILQNTTSVVFDTSLPKINLWILLTSLKFGAPSLRNYLCAFIRSCRAKVVVTTIDNSPIIYQLKDALPDVKVIVVQNGRRSTFGKSPFTSFTDELKRAATRNPNSVDYYFTFGSTEHSQFADLIDAEFCPIGNIKNNYLADEQRVKTLKVLTYISSFPNFDDDPSGSVYSDDTYLYFEDRAISYRQYFKSELVIASWLAGYCAENNLAFQIAGKRSDRTFQEEAFFRTNIPGNWEFKPCNSELDSYRTLLSSQFVASVDSSLAYEMFGRGKRTMFFTIRSEFTATPGLMCTNFGYPAITDSTGPMWTNNLDEGQFSRIMRFVTTCTDDEWLDVHRTFSPIVMQFDPLNSLLAKTLARCTNSDTPDPERVRALVDEIYG